MSRIGVSNGLALTAQIVLCAAVVVLARPGAQATAPGLVVPLFVSLLLCLLVVRHAHSGSAGTATAAVASCGLVGFAWSYVLFAVATPMSATLTLVSSLVVAGAVALVGRWLVTRAR